MHTTSKFQFVAEDSSLLKLFPHRWDFLFAEHCKPTESPIWQSESRHPLTDRLIVQGAKLYGVRFGAETKYFVLDIDKGSIYHPKRDRFATGRIFEALELLGITDHLSVTSSYSGGIHIYFPLAESVSSWQLAAVVTRCLTYKGFACEDGLLEVLPNERNFDAESKTPSLYKGHRLPLQAGSYLLNDWWELDSSTSEQEFCKRWEFCSSRNQLNWTLFNRVLKDITTNYRKLGFKASKFLEDLNTEIESGWTGRGQTNFLLGRVTLRAYVFGHYLEGGEPLAGDRLVKAIVETAQRLPGYKEWCRHQDEIWSRAEDWARCAEASRYYPFGVKRQKQAEPEKTSINWRDWRNNWLKQRARERVRYAITELLVNDRLPSTILERFEILTNEYGFSGETLYQEYHLDLWHPRFIGAVEPPLDPPNCGDSHEAACSEGAQLQPARSLLTQDGCNPNHSNTLEWFKGHDFTSTGCNDSPGKGFSDLSSILEFMKERSRDEGGDREL